MVTWAASLVGVCSVRGEGSCMSTPELEGLPCGDLGTDRHH